MNPNTRVYGIELFIVIGTLIFLTGIIIRGKAGFTGDEKKKVSSSVGILDIEKEQKEVVPVVVKVKDETKLPVETFASHKASDTYKRFILTVDLSTAIPEDQEYIRKKVENLINLVNQVESVDKIEVTQVRAIHEDGYSFDLTEAIIGKK